MQGWIPVNAAVKFLNPTLVLFSGLEGGPAILQCWKYRKLPVVENIPGLNCPRSFCLFMRDEEQGTEVKRLWVARHLSCGRTTMPE